MSFSKRQGIDIVKTLQLASMDGALRTSLWNGFHIFVVEPIRQDERLHYSIERSSFKMLFKSLWLHFFKWAMTSLPDNPQAAIEILFRWFFDEGVSWNHVYDFVEFVAAHLGSRQTKYHEFCNLVMEREASAYRFVGNIIAPLTSEAEIKTIEDVAGGSGRLTLVGTHIKDALTLLANRNNPNYRNSMKESISAIEAVVKLITGRENGTLGQMLDILGPRLDLHESLVKGFKALYAYTSDDHGIRHGLKDDRVPELEDARYFLVTCSAFVRYLIEKARKLGILPT